jgi:hypothetical protein
LGGRDRKISEFEVSLVYKMSSRTATLYRETLSQKTKQNKNKQTNKQSTPGAGVRVLRAAKSTLIALSEDQR